MKPLTKKARWAVPRAMLHRWEAGGQTAVVESSESSPTLKKTIPVDTYTGFLEMSPNILINVCQDFLIARSGFVKRHDVDRYIAES